MNATYRPPRILIVEDDAMSAEMLFQSLQSVLPENAMFRIAYTLEDAREWLDRERFHAILLDFRLPDGTGMELIEPLWEKPKASRPCIFLISGVTPDDFEAGRILERYPEITFVEKPFRLEALADLVLDRILPQSLDEQDFYGLHLFDLIQAYCIARRDVTLRILTPEGTMGMVALDQGELIHATVEGTEGLEALKRLGRSRRGRIRLDRGCPTARRSISIPTPQALLEAFRLGDEEENGFAMEDEGEGRRFEMSRLPNAPDTGALIDRLFEP